MEKIFNQINEKIQKLKNIKIDNDIVISSEIEFELRIKEILKKLILIEYYIFLKIIIMINLFMNFLK